jgi:hypothetical protein
MQIPPDGGKIFNNKQLSETPAAAGHSGCSIIASDSQKQ